MGFHFGIVFPLEMKEDKGKFAFNVSISVSLGFIKLKAVTKYTDNTSGKPSHTSLHLVLSVGN